MAPTPRPGSRAVHEADACREAAVLPLLYPQNNQWYLLLIERSPDSLHHPGQIAFPGGRFETNETAVQAALREAQEEVGCPQEACHVLGILTPLYIPPSGYCVTPVLAWLDHRPEWRLQDDEVAGVLEIPVADLIKDEIHGERYESRESVWMRIPYYNWQGHHIWGATAMMLAELLQLIKESRRGEY